MDLDLGPDPGTNLTSLSFTNPTNLSNGNNNRNGNGKGNGNGDSGGTGDGDLGEIETVTETVTPNGKPPWTCMI